MAINAIKQDENVEKHSNKEIIRRLLSYLKNFKFKVAIVVLLMIFVMVCGLLNPKLLQISIDKYVEAKNMKGIIYMGVILLALNFVSMIASKIRITLMASVTNKILLNIRHELYCHIQKLSFTFFDSRPVGKVLARIMGDVNSLQELFSNSITNFIPDLLNLIFVTIVMFYMNYKLALISVIIIPFLAVSMFAVESFSRRRWQKYRQKRSNFNAYTHESFSGVRVIQSFAVEDEKNSTFCEMVTDMMGSFVAAIRLNDLFWPLVEVSSGIGTVLLYWYSSKLINYGTITVGTLIAFTWYITMFWRPIINLSDFYNSMVINFAAAERIFEILDIQPDIKNKINPLTMPRIKGYVEFKNVSFSYEEPVKVLDNISFKINPGEKIALVGPTGAGKTTIINLISRFYEPQHGEILIDGIDVKDVDIESLRSQMGIMLQDTFLFSGSIKDNIRYGKLDATDEEILAAAKAVNAHGFISKLQNGYDTEVNERGSRLSVGQRQLISFARAMLANPRILILDEATSNIDTVTERLVQKGIETLLCERTSFVIAHRLSTIRDCDRIMVIDNGTIVESGTHDELIKYKGMYYDLYMAQYRFLSEGA